MHPEPLLDPSYTSWLHETMVNETSHCSVEQLEQIYSALMSELWKTRAEWDRGKVARSVYKVYEQVRNEITFCQGLAVSIEMEHT